MADCRGSQGGLGDTAQWVRRQPQRRRTGAFIRLAGTPVAVGSHHVSLLSCSIQPPVARGATDQLEQSPRQHLGMALSVCAGATTTQADPVPARGKYGYTAFSMRVREQLSARRSPVGRMSVAPGTVSWLRAPRWTQDSVLRAIARPDGILAWWTIRSWRGPRRSGGRRIECSAGIMKGGHLYRTATPAAAAPLGARNSRRCWQLAMPGPSSFTTRHQAHQLGQAPPPQRVIAFQPPGRRIQGWPGLFRRRRRSARRRLSAEH